MEAKRTVAVLAIVVSLCALASPVSAQIAYVNSAVGQHLAGNQLGIDSAAFSVTTGNLIACGYRQGSDNVPPTSVTDTAGNTYTRATGADSTWSATSFQSVWYAANITGHATNVVTVTGNGQHAYMSVVCFQFSGVATSSPLDTSASGSSASAGLTSITSGTFTTTQDTVVVAFATSGALNQTFVAGLIGGTTATAIVPDTAAGSSLGASEYRIVTGTLSSATAAMSFNSATGAGIGVVALKSAGGGAATTPKLSLLGVGQ